VREREPLLSVLDAQKLLGISEKTIRSWIAVKALRPRVLGRLGPGRGHKLDRWDLLVIIIIRYLLAFGLRLRQLKEGGVPFISTHAWFRSSVRGVTPDGREVEAVDAIEWEEFGERQMQRYLEMNNGNVIVGVHFLDMRQQGRTAVEMAIVPVTIGDWFLDLVKDADPDLPPGWHAFINCSRWASYIDRKLNEIF